VVLVSPLYRIAGYHGLFLGNALAFVGVVWLCFLIAQRLFRDLELSLNACLILVLATYAWQYSQAAWPHAASMLFVVGAFHLVLVALHSPRERTSLVLAFLAGLVTGIGVGVRLDVVFVLPALVLPFLFVSPWRPWRILAMGVGMLPGLAVLAVMNHAKFGIASPFTYGPTVGQARRWDRARHWTRRPTWGYRWQASSSWPRSGFSAGTGAGRS
jgi:4-amino-4-deoxy-L-arabinose transferase-like glycosyltransferase